MKYLIVLTDKYPYGTGETFIETERDYWEDFEHVYICPVIVRENDTLRKNFSCKQNETLISIFDKKPSFFCAISALIGSISFVDFIKEVKYQVITHKLSMSNIKKLVGIHMLTNIRAKKIWEKIHPLISEVKAEDILVYSYWLYEPVLVGIGMKRKYNQMRLISRVHGYDLYEERHDGNYLPYRTLVFKYVDLICPISTDGKAYLIEHYKQIKLNQISVERLGTNKLFENEDTVKQMQKEMIICSCSSLTSVKRVHLIVNAIMKSDNRITWYHFGDGPLKPDINLKILNLPSNIQVHLMGQVENREIQKFYSSHYIDAFINVSESEGVPVSIMEAQSYGIPVIATDVGGISELIRDGENGVLLPKDFSNEDLLEAITIVSKEQEKYRENAIQTWMLLSDAKKNYKEFFERELKDVKRN